MSDLGLCNNSSHLIKEHDKDIDNLLNLRRPAVMKREVSYWNFKEDSIEAISSSYWNNCAGEAVDGYNTSTVTY